MTGLGELLVGLNILEKLGKFWNWLRGKQSTKPETVVTRFIRLFESHGVHRNQIPRFIGHGLTLKDVQDDISLLAKLDESLLDDVCEKFAVRREWLDGAEKQIYPYHEFYKYPKNFVEFLDDLELNNREGNLHGVLVSPAEKDGPHAESLLILQETIGHVGEKPIYRYYLCDSWPLGYWKARGYVTACIAIAWKRHAFIHGVTRPNKEIAQLIQGETLLGWRGDGIWALRGERWYPEDMSLQPDAFLDGVDPERNNFGIESGLKLWLSLEEEGFMDSGIKTGARQLFERELAKYSNE
ncbi:hypothetical protein [Sideroxydans sp. CL21]|uniref:hypothetical protein n=1 Tax=Sideroxydans sp. CL21 TaxID=2600596 RepID=UPI0024BCE864|nr:hypothetical protein [Sideroxydans sp. CL21]